MKDFKISALGLEDLDSQEIIMTEGGFTTAWMRFLGPIGAAITLYETVRLTCAYLEGFWDGITEEDQVVTRRPE